MRSGRWSLEKPRRPRRLAAGALEIEAGRVHEHQIERAEEIAPPREQLLLDDVLQAARRKRRGPVLLVFGQLFAEPGHRPIEMMQVEALDALDPVILPPAVRRPIRAAGEQAVQNGEEHRALQREIMLAGAGEVFDDFPAAGLLPQSFERQRRPDAPRRTRRRLAGGDGVDDDRLGGEARARAQQPLQLPALAQILDAAERGDDLLAHCRALAPAFDDLQIGAAAGGLLAEIHGTEPWERLTRGPHTIGKNTTKVK